MKVLLVYPTPPRAHWPRGGFRSRWVPTGLASIAAVLLRAGHEVKVHVREEELMKRSFDWASADAALRELLRSYQPAMVGLSVVSPAIAEAQTIAAWAKELRGAETITVAGGPHPSAVPEMTLADCPAVDAAAVGEGEQTMLELAERGLDESIAGLVFRRGDEIVRTPARPPVADLDSLPPMPYELFDMDFYTQPSRWLIRWLDVSATNVRTSRGCTNRCRFCGGHLVAGVGVRFRSIGRVIEQLQIVADRWPAEAIRFEDDTIGADRSRLVELCRAIRAAGLHRRFHWDCCLRVDQVEADVLGEMRASGCLQVEYGFESGSGESLRRLGKGADADLNRRAVELTRAAGLRIFADIMVGLPGETEADLRATTDFLRWARPEVISAARLCPLPGTAIYDGLPPEVRRSIDWGAYTYLDVPGMRINLTAMSDARFEKLCRRFLRHFVRPATNRAMLRDSTRPNPAERRVLRRKLRRFVLRHPLRALRVPW